MRTRLLSAALLLAVLGAPPPVPVRADDAAQAAPSDQLRFANRETMTGDFKDLIVGKGLRFRHAECEGDMLVGTDHLDTLVLRSTPAAAKDAAGETPSPKGKERVADLRVTLNNGDTLAGKLVSFTPEKLVLDAPWDGRLEIAAAAVASMVPQDGSGTGGLDGLGDPGDWKSEGGNMQFVMAIDNGGGQVIALPQPARAAEFRNGQLVAPPTGVSRALGMKAESRLDMTIEGSDVFTVELLSTPAKNGDQASCAFCFGHDRVSVIQSTSRPEFMHSSPCARFRAPKREGPAEISLLADAKGRHLAVAVNGTRLGSLELPVETIGQRLVLRGQTRETRLTHLALLHGATSLADATDARDAADTAILANGDRVTGALLGIADGKASFKTDAATLTLPLARVRAFALSTAHDLAQGDGKDVARIRLRHAGRLTLRLAEIKDGRITGSAAGLGRLSLPLAAARQVDFNLDAKKAGRAAADAAWVGGLRYGVVQGFGDLKVHSQVLENSAAPQPPPPDAP